MAHGSREVGGDHDATLEAPRSALGVPEDRLDYLFSPRVRSRAVCYAVVVSVVASVATTSIRGERSYLIAWILAAAPLSTAAIVATFIVMRRSMPMQRNFWRLWLAGQVGNGSLGLVMLYVIGFSSVSPQVLLPLFYVPAACFAAALVVLVRRTLGRRALSVDVLDVMVASGAVAAVGALWLVTQLGSSGEVWHAVAFSLVAALFPGAIIISVRVFHRVSRGGRVSIAIGIALATVAALNAALQVGQNLSGFTLPTAPLVLMQCTVYSLMLLIAVFAPADDPINSADDLAHPHVRRHSVALVLVLVSVPVLIAEVVLQSSERWTVPFALAVLGALVALATIREYLSSRETQRLYREVERQAAERKEMLTSMLRAFEQDRHRTAEHLHEQAVGALVMMGSLVQASFASLPPGFSESLARSLVPLRAELAEQVESLRQFVLAIRPRGLESEPVGTAIAVCGSELFSDGPHVALEVTVDPELCLDWTAATIVYRVAEEALSNARRHSHASRVSVQVSEVEGVVQVDVADDGIGFDPGSVVESGIVTMRTFARLAGGRLEVRSAPGEGTVVRALLGDDPGIEVEPPPLGRLHLIVGGEHGDAPRPATAPVVPRD